MTQCWCDTVPAPSVSDDTVPSVHHGADVMQSYGWSDIVIWWLLSFVTDWCNVFAAVRLFDWTVTLELSVSHSVSVCRPHHCIQGRWSDKLVPRFTDPALRGKVRKYVGALPRNLHAKVGKSVHKSTPCDCMAVCGTQTDGSMTDVLLVFGGPSKYFGLGSLRVLPWQTDTNGCLCIVWLCA